MKTISDRLLYALEKKGWTPYRLHKESKVSQSTIGRILKDPSGDYNATTLASISNALNINYKWLVEGIGDELRDNNDLKIGDSITEFWSENEKFKDVTVEEIVRLLIKNKEIMLNNVTFRLFIENLAKDILIEKYSDEIDSIESGKKKVK